MGDAVELQVQANEKMLHAYVVLLHSHRLFVRELNYLLCRRRLRQSAYGNCWWTALQGLLCFFADTLQIQAHCFESNTCSGSRVLNQGQQKMSATNKIVAQALCFAVGLVQQLSSIIRQFVVHLAILLGEMCEGTKQEQLISAKLIKQARKIALRQSFWYFDIVLNMINGFVSATIDKLLDRNILRREDEILIIGDTENDSKLFFEKKFQHVTISNIDKEKVVGITQSYSFSEQNFNNLTFPDKSFDFVFVSASLHHSSRPHQALLEMYRVARKGIIAIESRDSWIMKLINMFNISVYEFGPLLKINKDGVDGSGVPNFVYRWTEREFIKTLQSFNPTGRHRFLFFYWPEKPQKCNYVCRVAFPIFKTVSFLFPKISNGIAMVAIKPGPKELHSWLKENNGKIEFNDDYKI